MLVWVDAWQLQCCGKPFVIGSEVEWTLRPASHEWLSTVLGDELGDMVDAVEERHGGAPREAPVTRGTVDSITLVHCRFVPQPVAGSGVLTVVEAAEKWIPDRDGLKFAGYLVGLRS